MLRTAKTMAANRKSEGLPAETPKREANASGVRTVRVALGNRILSPSCASWPAAVDTRPTCPEGLLLTATISTMPVAPLA
ncbi:hypothetical protein AU467_05845 [Mesorhizobium loti]|uniref:Uncharacterized protein n=1 Tax=Rhizobium loti TaxID=381 RepID=A0A101KPL2_RHILI|nr:hypothetical protein AU467_05845 [Mesorhizobium loti]